MQNQGSLGPTTVAELLQTMQQERATGTLNLASDGSQCSLHFLFGHLFHAVGGAGDGEPAVIDALGWQDGEYNFNPRAKLPPEETVNSSTEDLLALWRNGNGKSAKAPASATKVTVAATSTTARAAPATESGPDTLAGDDEDWLDSVAAAAEISAEVEEPADIPTFQTPSPQVRTAENSFVAPAVATSESRPLGGKPTNWPPNRPGSAATPPAERDRRPSQTRPGTVAPGSTASTAPAPRPVAGATKSQLSLLIPMPSGSSLHSGLKASFLNFPMLLRTLNQDGFSGYVSITGEKDTRNVGHILFREGAIIQAQLRTASTYRRHKAALQEVVRAVGAGDGLIDAIELPADLVEWVGGLIVASTAFLQLPSRIVDFDALVEYVEEQPLSGGILVTSGVDHVSVVLLVEGRAKGSYSAMNSDLTEGPGVAATACAERDARIDVVAAPPGPQAAIDLAEIA